MRYTFVTLLFISLLTGCGTTGVVKLKENHFMVSTKSARVGFVNASEEKAHAYMQANKYCAEFGKEVKTIKLNMRNSGFVRNHGFATRPASASLEFSCVSKQ